MKTFHGLGLVIQMALFLAAMVAVAPAAEPKPALTYVDNLRPNSQPDGGLRLAVGVHNTEVYRANRTAPTHVDHLTDTYLHQPMLAYWHDKYYLLYLSGPVDESQAPCSDSLTTSTDALNWATPRTVFPSIKLPDGSMSIMHQRMAFNVSSDDRLLVLGFHGKAPEPSDGTGVGRVVREIHADGSFGPIYFIRYGEHSPWKEHNPTYPFYKTSSDAGFVAACDSLLSNKVVTQQWWEEDQFSTDSFTIHGKAMSYTHRPDGSILAIWKNALTAVTTDHGLTWSKQMQATNLPNNGSKYWLQHTSDNRYALFLNPTDRRRQPLAVLTSSDAVNFSNLLTIDGESPDQRFPGRFKNLGPQYVRGIEEGTGNPPEFTHATRVVYSVNKEDIWTARVPVPIRDRVESPVNDNFETDAVGTLPANWNIYSPVWAPVRIVNAAVGTGHALELRDEDPNDYARAIRIFPETHGVQISFKVLAQQTNARLEIEIQDGHGLRPVRLALAEDGHFWACHEGIWTDGGPYQADRWLAFSLEIPRQLTGDRVDVRLDGKSVLPRPANFTEAVTSVERLSFRTGAYRAEPVAGQDLPGADRKVPAVVFQIDDVVITPQK
jgi:hypothetical protein